MTLGAWVALSVAAGSCADSPTGLDLGDPVALNAVSGSLQEAPLGELLGAPLVVRVLDGRGRSVPAVPISWATVSGGAIVTPSVSFTDSTGTASAIVRLGESLGEQRITASHGNLTPAEFIVEAHPHPVTYVEVISGDWQEAPVESTLPMPIVVQIRDARQDPVAGIPVTFQTLSGSATPSADTTDASGMVATTWTLGAQSGYVALTIRAVDGLETAMGAAQANAIPLPVDTIVVLTGADQTGIVNSQLATPISVQVLTAGGVPSAGRSVWVSAYHGSTPQYQLFTGQDGVATTTWQLGTTAGVQRLHFQVDNDSAVVTATAFPAAPTDLQIVSGDGQAGPRNQPLSAPLVAAVTDQYDNPIPGVTVSFATLAGNGSFDVASAVSDSLGRVSATWTLPDALGPVAGTLSYAGGPTVAVTATATQGIQILDHRVLDAEYHAGTNRLVTVSSSPAELHIVDPATAVATSSIALPTDPTAVSISPDGSVAAVGHDGYVTIVDLDAAAVLDTWPVGADVLDVILAGNGYAYVLPRRDQWESVRSLEVATGDVTPGGSIYAGAVGRLHPSGDYIYLSDNNISPADIRKFDIRNGVAEAMYDSRYHGDFAMGGNHWYSASGDRIYTARATVFTSTTAQATDIEYLTSFSGTSQVAWASHSAEVQRVAVVARSDWWSEPSADTLRIYTDTFLNYLGSLTLPLIPRAGESPVAANGLLTFFSADGQTLYVLLRAPDAAGLILNSALTAYSFAELPAAP